MKNEEYHLDWSKYNWRDFEKICFEYVKATYSAQFYKRKLTRGQKDKGRDIIIQRKTGDYEAWGECKDHKRNIDLSVIGKNVVLALSHQINKVIFFSVTCITINTKIEILNLAQTNGFEVLFLDGKDLDQEIINCRTVAKKYFRKEYELYIVNNKTGVWLDTYLSEYPFAEDSLNNTKKQYHLQNGFEIFLHIFLKNMRDEDIVNIQFQLKNICDNNMIFYKRESVPQNTLASHSDFWYTFKGMIFSSKKEIEMPQIEVIFFSTNGSMQKVLMDTGVVDASDIWKAPYINSKSAFFYQNVTNILENTVPERYVRILFLYGRSGMGKSRLIREIENKAFENSYRVIHIDFRIQEESVAFRMFIMSLLNIPLSKTKMVISEDEFNTIFHESLEQNELALLYNFLFVPDTEVAYKSILCPVISLLVQISQKDSMLVSIDNIQELSSELQIFFWNILEHLHNISVSICFLLAQNTERRNSIDILSQYLEMTGEGREDYILSFHCDLLEEGDAVTLMQHLLHMESGSEEYIKELLRKIELCPLDILLLAKTLEQTPKLFTKVGEYRYISTPTAFPLYDKRLAMSADAVIEMRLKNIDLDIIEQCNKFFSVITFFEGELPLSLFTVCGFEFELLDKTNRNLITKVDIRENKILFYHDKIDSYMERNKIGISSDILEKLVLYFDTCKPENIKSCYLYAKLLRARSEHQHAIELGLNTLNRYKHSNENKYVCKICDLLLDMISAKEDPINYFLVIFQKADLLLERVSLPDAEALFEEAKKRLVFIYAHLDPKIVSHFYHRYTNQKIHTLQYEKAFDVLDEFRDKFKDKNGELMIIHDRMCVALYSLGRDKEALSEIDETIRIAEEEDNAVWLSIAYSDQAFCHYYNSKDRNLICQCFTKAIKYYEESKYQEDISRKIEIQMQKTIVCILQCEEKEAIQNIQEGILAAEKAGYGYLLVPAYNIYAFINITKGNIEDMQNILKKALLYANTFSNPKSIVSIYNNWGSYYAVSGDFKCALSYYTAAFSALKEICVPQNSFRYLGLLCNLVKIFLLLKQDVQIDEILKEYPFNDIKEYLKKCQSTMQQQLNLEDFGYGILVYKGYDFLY